MEGKKVYQSISELEMAIKETFKLIEEEHSLIVTDVDIIRKEFYRDKVIGLKFKLSTH